MKFKIIERWVTYNQARLGNNGKLQVAKTIKLYRYEPNYHDDNCSWREQGDFPTVEEAKEHAELLKKRGASIITEFDL